MKLGSVRSEARRSVRWAAAPRLALLVVVMTATGLRAQEEHAGLTEYELACMACHGVDGRGDGPHAKDLAKRPADLTQISKANNGRFPVEDIRKMIDGRADVKAHGPRDMPVWGERYRSAATAEGLENAEQLARAQIDALVSFVESIQEP